MNRVEELINALKSEELENKKEELMNMVSWNELLNKKEEKKTSKVVWIFAIIGIIILATKLVNFLFSENDG